MSKALDVLLKHGKITQEQYDVASQKDNDKKAAKENYVKNKAKMSKAELQAVLDVLCS